MFKKKTEYIFNFDLLKDIKMIDVSCPRCDGLMKKWHQYEDGEYNYRCTTCDYTLKDK